MTTDRACFICDEGYNGDKPCPQCNTEAWNAYHEQHKQTIDASASFTVVERRVCGHERWPVSFLSGDAAFDGAFCPLCRDVVDVRPVRAATAETVE